MGTLHAMIYPDFSHLSISYYSKRPAINDPRLALLPKDLFTGKRVLDVGCNEGHVTCELGKPRFPAQDVGLNGQRSGGAPVKSSAWTLTTRLSARRGGDE